MVVGVYEINVFGARNVFELKDFLKQELLLL